MSHYMAPLRDMRLVLEELAALDEIAAFPGCADVTPDLAAALLEEAGRPAAEALVPLNFRGDREGSRREGAAVSTPGGFAEAYRQFVEGGWNGLSAPPGVRRPATAGADRHRHARDVARRQYGLRPLSYAYRWRD